METKNTPEVMQNNVSEKVLARINEFQQAGEMALPTNYSPENALKSAWLILQETEDRNHKPVLQICTQKSIANALLDMVVQGLSPMKKQCYFIAYGNKLQLSRSYLGSIAVAKRVGEVTNVVANAIYKNDTFKFMVDAESGIKKITAHEQDLESLSSDVVGAYAVLSLKDGSKYVEVMNIDQIRTAWNQGATKGNSPAHKNFTDEMAKKTVINRACKLFISTSDDSGLYEEKENDTDPKTASIKQEIADNANKQDLIFDDADVVEEETNQEPKAEPVNEPPLTKQAKPSDNGESKKEPVKAEPGF